MKLFRQVNVEGTRNVMETALEAGIKKIVHVSTVGIYGKPKDCPFTENSEVGPVRFGEYFRTKYEGDGIVWELYKSKNLPVVMVYPAAVLGAGDLKATGQYIRRIIKRQLPARVLEERVFTFVHVDDVAEVILKAAEKENNLGEKYIAGKHQMTFGEINKQVSEISGVSLPRLRMPDSIVVPSAGLLTLLADVIKKPPLWGMAVDQMRVMKEEIKADGSKAERELGISYTPIRNAIEDTIGSLKM
jgi:dihydroflavonol-4-reductase